MGNSRIDILAQYADAKARVKYLRRSVNSMEEKYYQLIDTDKGVVSDVVVCGRKRRKPLGTVRITGLDVKKVRDTENRLEKEKERLKVQEGELLALLSAVEDFVESIENIEYRNILTFYYIEDMTWIQVAAAMNELYGKQGKRVYTDDSCRKKHDRFLEKIKKF